jgi:hypothetical protein
MRLELPLAPIGLRRRDDELPGHQSAFTEPRLLYWIIDPENAVEELTRPTICRKGMKPS